MRARAGAHAGNVAPMSELAEVTAFLGAREPWSALPRGQLAALARRAEAVYFPRGRTVLSAGDHPSNMFVIRSGAVEVRDVSDQLVTIEEEGGCFGQSSIVERRPSRFSFTAVEDTLLWRFDASVVDELVALPKVSRYFTDSRLGDATQQGAPEGGPVLQVRVEDMLTRGAVSIRSDATVRDAARLMDERRISSIVVTRDDRLVGILTDRDLRRVVARQIPGETPLREVMTLSPVTVSPDALALDVLLTLVENRIHHLPVVRGDQLLGMVTSGDLMRLERSSPLYLVGDLARQGDVEGLAAVMRRVPGLVTRLLRQDATAEDIGRIVSRTTDALWQRLGALAEERFGPPPVAYCWVALGSLARQEQALGSDQDHAFILSDEALPEHDDYFGSVAAFLTDALVECGFPRCRGEVMATNPRWRQPVAGWWRTFSAWLASPTADAVLGSSIFFDMRPVFGEADLAAGLQRRILAAAPGASRFLGHLASHANDIEVPLGFLRGLVVERQGSHRDQLDIKKGGLTPIVDVARLYALRWGLPQVGTRPRLAAAALHGIHVDNLLDAHEYLGYTRLQHQGRQVGRNEEPDNHLAPSELTEFERRSLRDAFWYVSQAQKALTVTFQTQFIG